MPYLEVYVDDVTLARLIAYGARDSQSRSPAELAEAAVAEAALQAVPPHAQGAG